MFHYAIDIFFILVLVSEVSAISITPQHSDKLSDVYIKEEEAEFYSQNLLIQKLEETIERLERELADYEQELYENDRYIRGGSI
jgi:hypothetical protein